MLYIAIDNSIGGGTGLPGSGGGGGGFTNTYSTQFDGVDDYVDLTSSVDLGINNTICAWVKRSDIDNIDSITGESSFSGQQNIYISAKQRVYMKIGSFSTFWYNRSGFGILNQVDTWFHLAIVRSGNDATLYLNGSATFVKSGWGTSITTKFDRIGAQSVTGNNPMFGNLDEIVAFDRVLTLEEITSIASEPTDLTSLSPIAWYRMGDNGSYKSPQWLLPNNENKDKISNYSTSFDGIDDYIGLGSDSSLDIFGSDFTISLWAKWGNQTSSSNGLINFAANTNKAVITLGFGSQYGKISFGTGSASTIGILYDCGSGYNDNNWHHIMCTLQGTTRTVYVDGVDISSTGSGSSIGVGSNNDIGNRARSRYFVGNIDEVSIFNSVVPIGDLWDGSGEPTTISGAVAYYKMGEESTFTSNWLVNNSALTNYSKRSFAFDGVDDYINIGNAISFEYNDTFSYSFWVKPDVVGGVNYLYSKYNSSGRGILLYYNSNGAATPAAISLGLFNTNSGSISTRKRITTSTGNILTKGMWNNIVITYDGSGLGSGIKLYKNGVSQTVTVTQDNLQNSTILNSSNSYLGAFNGTGGFLTGMLDEFAIFNTELSSADALAIYNSGEPTTLPSGAVAHYRMGEDASFNGTNWTVPDQVGTNTGTSANMTVDDLVGEAPNYSGGGISSGMTIEDRVGEAPNSDNNALSFNMDLVDRTTDVPT